MVVVVVEESGAVEVDGGRGRRVVFLKCKVTRLVEGDEGRGVRCC